MEPLAPAEKLVGKLPLVLPTGLCRGDSRHDLARTNDAQVQIGRQAARAMRLRGVVAGRQIAGLHVGEQPRQPILRRRPAGGMHGADGKRVVDDQSFDQIVEIAFRKVVGDEWQRARVGRGVGHFILCVHPGGALRLVPAQEARTPRNVIPDQRQWHQTGGIHRIDRSGRAPGDPPGLPPRDEGRLILHAIAGASAPNR